MSTEMENRIADGDLYLLIPGKLGGDKSFKRFVEKHTVGDFFNKAIQERVEDESSSDFICQMERFCFGDLTVTCGTGSNKDKAVNAIANIAVHKKTGICVLEIIIRHVDELCNLILQYYCGEELLYDLDGEAVKIRGLAQKLGIELYGKKRSMVFAYGEVSKQAIINALANEDSPMGTIGGDFARKVELENIAQYDTAQVYVSTATMFEKCTSSPEDPNERMEYQTVEIFFVEMLLMQDAAIDKIYEDIKEEEERQRCGKINPKETSARIEEINFDMSQAIRFADYEQFYYPTVRESSKKVAAAFGIEHIFNKYESNQQLLSRMVQTNMQKVEAEQSKIKDMFLLLLAGLTAIDAVDEVIARVLDRAEGELVSYLIATGVVIVVYLTYLIVAGAKQRKYERSGKGNDEENE